MENYTVLLKVMRKIQKLESTSCQLLKLSCGGIYGSLRNSWREKYNAVKKENYKNKIMLTEKYNPAYKVLVLDHFCSRKKLLNFQRLCIPICKSLADALCSVRIGYFHISQ
ncbi:unnamed protein product [Moneuplotes crassus]|uniref:Uncharacterized protein n=1 Tax=Euplotes crassus TaxID=5936 RepID=A0AAD1XKA1_EUPCR|nr:unnamed protein product [Moneuplotes crassus]